MKNHFAFKTLTKVRIIDEESQYHNQVGIIIDQSKHSLKAVIEFANGDKRAFLKNRLTSYLPLNELERLKVIHQEILIDMALHMKDKIWFEYLVKEKSTL